MTLRSYYTSRPYPPIVEEAADTGFSIVRGSLWVQPIDFLDHGFSVSAGALTAVLHTYGGPAEPLDHGFGVVAGSLAKLLVLYDNWPAEPINNGFSVISGVLA